MACAQKNGGATVGYEAQPWQIPDPPRGSLFTAECRHACLGAGRWQCGVPLVNRGQEWNGAACGRLSS